MNKAPDARRFAARDIVILVYVIIAVSMAGILVEQRSILQTTLPTTGNLIIQTLGGVTFEQLGAGGNGWTNEVIVNPQNDDVVWVATDNAGIFKTENGGQSWRRMTGPEPEF